MMAPATSPSVISFTRAGLPDLADQVLVAGPVEDADGQVADVGALGLGDQAQG